MIQIHRGEKSKLPLSFQVGGKDVQPDQIYSVRIVRGEDVITTFDQVLVDDKGKYFVYFEPDYNFSLGSYLLDYDWRYGYEQYYSSEELVILVERRGDYYLRFTNLLITSFSLHFLDIAWEVEFNGNFEPKFVVSKGLSESDVFVDISPELVDQYYYRDYQVELRNVVRPYYYIVSAYDDNNNLLARTEPATLAYQPDRLGLAIADETRRYLQVAFGRKVLLFKQRRFGQRCSCWDPELGKVTKSRCLRCFSTGWVGGYHRPMIIYAQILDLDETELPVPTGKAQPKRANLIVSNYPLISPGDLIVEQGVKVWRINSIRFTTKRRTVVRQQAELNLVVPGDIEYELPIKTEYFETADEINLWPKYDLEVKT